MNKAYFFLNLLPLFFSFVGAPKYVRAQQSSWPIHYRTRIDEGASVKQGYIVLKNSDTLRGYIKLLPISSYFPIMIMGRKDVLEVNIDNIQVMRVYTPFLSRGFTDYININHKHTLWRLNGQRGDIAIYDNELNMNGPQMILVTRNKRIKLFSQLAWVMHNGNSNPLLLKFINRRYKTAFTKEKFKTTQDFIDFILMNEN